MAAVSPARRCAFAVVRRTFEDGAYTDRALRAEAARAGLEGRDLALATALAFGTVQRAATLDHLIERLAGRAPDRLDPPVLAALRLGLFQLCFLDGIPGPRTAAAIRRYEESRGQPQTGNLDRELLKRLRQEPK